MSLQVDGCSGNTVFQLLVLGIDELTRQFVRGDSFRPAAGRRRCPSRYRTRRRLSDERRQLVVLAQVAHEQAVAVLAALGTDSTHKSSSVVSRLWSPLRIVGSS